MQTSISNRLAEPASLTDWLQKRARSEGFDAFGIASPSSIAGAERDLHSYLQAGFHGEMSWMETNGGRRASPLTLWPEVQSIVMLGLNYGPSSNPLAALEEKSHGAISVYAQGDDYHDVIKPKLKRIAREFAEKSGAGVKVFVDTAPVMEKPLADAAGLGWQGKHTNLVSREFGSWLFLGSIFTTAKLAPFQAEGDRCGACRRCLDICPTNAFPAPYRIDARRCISYLTIEHKGPVPHEFREAIGNRIYGCDDCLAVCPWNKFASLSNEVKFASRDEGIPPLAGLLLLDDAAFRKRFAKSPIKRIGRDRFLRNVLIAAGNSADGTLRPAVEPLLDDRSALVRGAAVWALSRLLKSDLASFLQLRGHYLTLEQDDDVRGEWRLAETL